MDKITVFSQVIITKPIRYFTVGKIYQVKQMDIDDLCIISDDGFAKTIQGDMWNSIKKINN